MTDKLAMFPPPILTFLGPENPRVLSFFFDCSLQKPLYVGEVIEFLKAYFGIESMKSTWFPEALCAAGLSELEGWGYIVAHTLYLGCGMTPVLLYSDREGRLLEIRTWSHEKITEFFADAYNLKLNYAWSLTALNLPQVQEDFRISGIDIRETF